MNRLRERLIKLKQNGINYSFISEKLNVSNSLIYKFIKEERNLSEQKQKELEDILNKIENLYY